MRALLSVVRVVAFGALVSLACSGGGGAGSGGAGGAGGQAGFGGRGGAGGTGGGTGGGGASGVAGAGSAGSAGGAAGTGGGVGGVPGVGGNPGVGGAAGAAGVGGAAGAGGGAAGVGGGAAGGGGSSAPCTACTDFPTSPILAPGVSASAPSMFGAPTGSGPCVTEPEDGALFPSNWLQPRVRVPGSTGLLKITFHADREANDLVAYASGETWSLPKGIWSALASHVVDQDVTVTVQIPGGGATAVRFRIAPAAATGSIVFSSMDPTQVGKPDTETMAQSAIVNDALLKGFAPGDQATVDVLKITDVQQQVATQNGNTQGSHCIGCHVGTPDGNYVGFVDAWPWGAALADIQSSNLGQALTTISGSSYAGGTCSNWNSCTGPRTYLQYPWMGPMTFSKAHWSAGDQIAIIAAQLPTSDLTMPWNTDDFAPGNLVWLNTESTAGTTTNGVPIPLRGTAFDYMQHTGDLGGVAFPTWSHDGNTIVYASTPGGCTGGNGCTPGDQDGRLNIGRTDLYAVPYNNKAGGVATPVPGASTSSLEEYYPAFSPDDQLIAYTAVPAGQAMYANQNAEMFVVPHAAGANAIRLNANDPPACSGLVSPGINNHWPRFAPVAPTVAGRTYYWLVFSTNHYGLPTVTSTFSATTYTVAVSQLYVTAIVVNEAGPVATYPAVYLWNQPQNRVNDTPAWEDFHIPAVLN